LIANRLAVAATLQAISPRFAIRIFLNITPAPAAVAAP
jgi:hypothetical protein